MTETYLWAALALVHLLGAWLMYAMVEAHEGLAPSKTHGLYFLLCLVCWEGLVIWTIFEKTAPHEN